MTRQTSQQPQMNSILATIQQLHKQHLSFLSNFTLEMVNYFSKMKQFYHQEEIKRKRIFEQQKEEISKMVLEKNLQRQKIDQMLSKKQAKKQKSQRKKRQKQIKLKLKAPKTPNTPYFMFFIDYKQKIKQDFPQYSMIQTAKMAGKLWKQLQEHEKSIYYQKHEEDKRKFAEDMKQYKQKRKKWENEEQEKTKWQNLMRGECSAKEQKTNITVDMKRIDKDEQKKEDPESQDKNKGLQIQVELSISCSEDSRSQEWGVAEVKQTSHQINQVNNEQQKFIQNVQTQFKLPQITTQILERLKEESNLLIEKARKQFIKYKDTQTEVTIMNCKNGQLVTSSKIMNNQSQTSNEIKFPVMEGVEHAESTQFNDGSFGDESISI